MGVYIKDMEMPKGRSVCIVIDAAGQARRYDLNNDRYADDELFEAVSVPPYRDLIGANKLAELPIAKHCDGHTEEDVIRLLSLDMRPVVTCINCLYNNACLTQAFVEDASRVPFDRNIFFCADGKRADDA